MNMLLSVSIIRYDKREITYFLRFETIKLKYMYFKNQTIFYLFHNNCVLIKIKT